MTDLVGSILGEFAEKDRWQVELAARLTQIGSLTFPTELRRKIQTGGVLDARESDAAARQPEAAFRLLKDIPRLGQVAEMIRHHGAPPDNLPSGHEVGDGAELVAAGAHALDVVATYQAHLIAGGSAATTNALQKPFSSPFRARLLKRLLGEPARVAHTRVESVVVSRLVPDMVVNEDVRSTSGTLLLGKGHRVTAPMIQRLARICETIGVVEPFEVVITIEAAA